ADARVGDTITHADNPTDTPLPGYKRMNPMVYCGLYPIDSADYVDLREALERLQLNDSALEFEAESSQALGCGYRTRFLGWLHMDIIKERLEREFGTDRIATAPSVIYKVHTTDGEVLNVDTPSQMPSPDLIAYIEEPFVEAQIMVPSDYVGPVMELCQKNRG